jgi:putative PIN family toxin of toxin-antitoxin system
LSGLVELWKAGRIVPVLSRETFEEFRAVLLYPKFRLNAGQIKSIIEEEVLPFFEVTEATGPVHGICKDPDDDKFIACAVSASAPYIVSGDKHLCEIGRYKSDKIISPGELVRLLGTD